MATSNDNIKDNGTHGSHHLIRWTTKALQLKKKELKWKLLMASQIQNRAKLDEIKREAIRNRKQMIKANSMAARLKARYLEASKAAESAESLYNNLKTELSNQEKFVAEEKMELAKLALDCRDIGNQLYGSEYKLENIKMTSTGKKIGPSLQETRLSSLYDLNNSILKNLAAYRLTSKYSEFGNVITDQSYTHNINPHEFICLTDFAFTCQDKSCPYQHEAKYIMTDIDKLADILSYKPSLTGFKPDHNSTQEKNFYQCRLKLKQYAANLISKNSDKSIETIAQNLVKYVRGNKTDSELIVSTRRLPKSNHIIYKSIDKPPTKLEPPSQGSDMICDDEQEVNIIIDTGLEQDRANIWNYRLGQRCNS